MEEDESKTSRHNSPVQRRCQSQILLKSKYQTSNKESSQEKSESSKRDTTDSSHKECNKAKDVPEYKPSEEESDSEEEDEDGVDPEIKEKERKISEKRILEIVHTEKDVKNSNNVSSSNEILESKKDSEGRF